MGGSFQGTYVENRERNRRFAAMAATIFGADADEIALTHSATEGLGTALMGMTWSPGDEIITTFQEHPGLMLPLALLARRFGVVTRYADIGDGASGVVEALASRITSRTRVIAVSHVLWSTGAVLPLREISALARQHELMVVVDGAQSAGQVPVDLHAMGIDAYAMAGQKWLCGPEATGLLCPQGSLCGYRADLRPLRAIRAERIFHPRGGREAVRDRRVLQPGGGRPGGGAALAARRGGFRLGIRPHRRARR